MMFVCLLRCWIAIAKRDGRSEDVRRDVYATFAA